MKPLLRIILIVLVIFSISSPSFAASTITGNNSFETAYYAGYWKYSNMHKRCCLCFEQLLLSFTLWLRRNLSEMYISIKITN